MLKIGVLAEKNSSKIVDSLTVILKSNNNLIAIKNNSNRILKDVDFFEKNGIEYSIIIFNSSKIYPVSLDILILDNEDNKRIVSYELIKCIGENTILIYNTDNGYLPHIEHPNAIDYGFCSDSTVSISSVDYSDNKISLIVSIQKPFQGIYEDYFDICEFLIETKYITKISNLIPAVICGLVIGAINYTVLKI